MGFASMGELTHAMEDVFDRLRQDKIDRERELIDALFGGLDSLKAMMDEIASDRQHRRDTTVRDGAAARRSGRRAESDSASRPGNGQRSLQEAGSGKQEIVLPSSRLFCPTRHARRCGMRSTQAAPSYGLKMEVAPDCVMKSVRALMALQALDRVSSMLASLPDEEAT